MKTIFLQCYLVELLACTVVAVSAHVYNSKLLVYVKEGWHCASPSYNNLLCIPFYIED